MARMHGRQVRIYLGELDVSGDLDSISPEFSADTHEKTVFGDDWKEFGGGLLGWLLNIGGLYDLTKGAVSAAIQEDNSGASFVDETADANNATANDVEIPDPFDTDDALYIGADKQFSSTVINIGTQGAGDAVEAETIWEYWNGSAWATLESGHGLSDGTTALTAAVGSHTVALDPPSDWETTTVNSQGPFFYIRLRATADDVYNTTQPKITQGWVLELDLAQKLDALLGASGDILSIYDGDADAIGENGWVFPAGVVSGQTVPISVAELMRLTGTIQGSGQAGAGAKLLHVLGAETEDGNSTSVDNSALSAKGGRANLHVTAITGQYTVKIQHSTDDADWVDLIAFTQADEATGPTSESKTVTGTVNRYIRALWTEDTAGSCTFVTGFARY